MSKVRDFIGPYRLARLIRTGNSASVWEAIKDDNERFCLKILRQDFRKNKDEIAALKQEFVVAHNLKHPNVIRVYEFNMDGGKTPYLVLELYNEQNMKIVLRDGHDKLAYYFPKIVQQSAEALYHLHENGWVHCDIKPDNLLVSSDGDIKLIDFSIAQKIKGISRLFGGSKAKGTRSYMSPEQIRGKPLDERADVYAYGCVLHELLTGRPPYTGNTGDELLQKHLRSAIPSTIGANHNVTPECANLIKRLMSKKPEDRPQSMWDFLKEFRAIKPFKKAPRLPTEKLVADTEQYDNPDSLLKKAPTESDEG